MFVFHNGIAVLHLFVFDDFVNNTLRKTGRFLTRTSNDEIKLVRQGAVVLEKRSERTERFLAVAIDEVQLAHLAQNQSFQRRFERIGGMRVQICLRNVIQHRKQRIADSRLFYLEVFIRKQPADKLLFDRLVMAKPGEDQDSIFGMFR